MAENMDISKLLPPSFFEGITSAYIDKLSKAFEAKLKSFNIKNDKVKAQSLDLNPLQKLFESFGANVSNVVKPPNKEVKEISDVEVPKTVIIGGFTDEGIAKLKKGLPTPIANKVPENKMPIGDIGGMGSWATLGLAGLTLLAGGLYALYKGLESNGAFKGLLKLVSRVGVQGGLVVLEKATQILIQNITKIIHGVIDLIHLPAKIFSKIGNVVNSIFGVSVKETTGAIAKSGGKEAIAAGAKKIGGILAKSIKFIPFVGALIGVGFAISRIKQGDYVGGFIDLLSGIASCFPVAGTWVSLALDAFNMFLDVKAGGTPEAGGKAKGGILMDWAADLGEWAWSKLKKVPFFNSLSNAVNHFLDGDIFEGIKSLSHCFGGPIAMLLNYFGVFVEQPQEENVPPQTFENIFIGIFKWMKDTIYDKVANFAKKIGGSIKDAWNKMLGITESNITILNHTRITQPEATTTLKGSAPDVNDFISRKNTPTFSISSEDSLIGFKTGGPIDTMLNGSGHSDNSKVLGSIEKNTDNTNNALRMLGESLFKLIDVLNKQTANQGVNVYPKQIQQLQDKKTQALQTTTSKIDLVRNQFLNSIYTT